ncbi:DUF2292 domain-containing protein [Thermomonas sp.]|uniref:DUF2292 domain-containing protein n=1 Tax=Thermomonas sp. TaxID=1971895 RepID=UPI0035AFDB59
MQQPPESTPMCAQASPPEAAVLRAIRDTAYGTVEVVVHQSRIVQITRSEKVRFDQPQHDAR